MSDTEPDDGQSRQDEDSPLARADRELDWFRGPKLSEVREQFSGLFSKVDWYAHGGWGLVYRAKCRKTGVWLALKLLDPEAAVDEEAKRRFRREATALQRLSDEHIVGIRDSGCRGPFHYIVMDFATGETLRDRLGVTALPQKKALRVALQITKALRHAHGKGVIHRDLKPENVRIDAQDEVKLVDFGIAKILNPTVDVTPLTAEGQVVGTGCYMAPEQRAGATVDHRADIFAVGVVLYEMLTGVKPEGKFELASQLAPGIDESVDELLNKAMSRDPDERQENAAELCLELEQAIANVEAGLPSKRSWNSRFWAACKRPCTVGVALATTAAGVWNACDPWVHRWPLAEFAGTSLGTIGGFQITGAGVFLLLAVVIAWIVVLRSPDSSVMRRLPNRGPHDPARRFRDDLRSVRKKLVKTLEDLNVDLDWTNALYEPIEAEVEVSRGGRSQRRLRDVVSALRAERRHRVILLVGYPGGGKSVILRHLAIKLLTDRREVQTGRIPVYVDLKGWKPAEEWTREAPPTEQQLQEFVRHAVLDCLDEKTASFLHQHFEQFLEQGRFFFLLDSFDEIPAIQDVADDSWLVRELSNVVWKFLNGAHESRGVVASRPFRQPKFNSAAPELATLTLRDFDDWQIHEALLRSPKIKEQEARSFFTDHPNLVPLARTPLYTSMIREQLESKEPLPATLHEVFQRHIQGRLNRCDVHFGGTGLTLDDVWDTATEIAWLMFSEPKELGSRVPLAELERRLPDRPVRAVANVLKDARLARLAAGRTEEFSFIHRRFQEFFLARRLLAHPEQLDLDCIGQNTGYRDALVLVAEVADNRTARCIAEFCWEIITAADESGAKPGDPAYEQALHCLRFLSEAFGARSECLERFIADFAKFVLNKVQGDDILAAKHAIEAAGLLPTGELATVLKAAVQHHSRWVRETSLRACRSLPRLDPELLLSLKRYLLSMDLQDVVIQRRRLSFTLSLFEASTGIRSFRVWRRIDVWLSAAASILFVAISPLLAGACGLLAAIFQGASSLSSPQTFITDRPLVFLSDAYSGFKELGAVALSVAVYITVMGPSMGAVCGSSTMVVYDFIWSSPAPTLSHEERGGVSTERSPSRGWRIAPGRGPDVPADRITSRVGATDPFAGPQGRATRLAWDFLTPLFAKKPPPYDPPWGELHITAIVLIPLIWIGAHRWLVAVEWIGFHGKRLISEIPPRDLLEVMGTVLGVVLGVIVAIPICTAFLLRGAIVTQDWLDGQSTATVNLVGVVVRVAALAVFVWLGRPILRGFVSHWKSSIADRKLLRQYLSTTELTRGEIEDVLRTLRDSDSCLKFVKLIQRRGIVPTGMWSNGLPNCNDGASTLLAQLEEGWLKLDR